VHTQSDMYLGVEVFQPNLLGIGKDITQHLCRWLTAAEKLALYCTCKGMGALLDKVDREVWYRHCHYDWDPLKSEEDIKWYHTKETIEPIVDTINNLSEIRFGSYRKFYLQYHHFDNKSFVNAMMAEYLKKRIIESKLNRRSPNFLDVFLEITQERYGFIPAHRLRNLNWDEDEPENPKMYPKQLMKLDVTEQDFESMCNISEGILTLKFVPCSPGKNIYDFQMFEGNHSHPELKVISRLPGQGSKVLYLNLGSRTPRYTLLSRRDREILGDFFMNDKLAYCQQATTSLNDHFNTSHGFYRNQIQHNSDTQSRMQRKANSTAGMVPIAVKVIKFLVVTYPIKSLFNLALQIEQKPLPMA
jgi:hypothetical protein